MVNDPIEILERSQERAAECNQYDPETNTMNCADCGKPFPLAELWPASSHPASAFVCECCLNSLYGPDAPGPYTRENLT